MKKFVVFLAVLLVVICSFGVQGQPIYIFNFLLDDCVYTEPHHYPNVPVGDDSVMNVHEGETISHLASRFFFNAKHSGGRGGNAGGRGNGGHGTGLGGKIPKGGSNDKKVTGKPKLTE
ncbi:hypothetical protein B9Z55_027759 [Caenorhabditis nigoni]|uniref:Uncharacterized protein n=1 Tax=Caenorhabditis nigoni TaxID=1611254 RepID=A0A2G5SEK6_9PELO|nr:hypothetical protein B9Z55_027759 [Caenorhabditis nigoni]